MTRVNKFIKILVSCAFAANLIAYIIYSVFYDASSAEVRFHSDFLNLSDSIRIRNDGPVSGEKFKRNIFFLKTHKTAGSTVQNAVMRFGLRHSLNFMLPKKHNYLGYVSRVKLEDMDGESVPPDKKFNILAHHSRYRRHTSRFLYADAVRVTILRDPAELFESVFDYYNLEKVWRISFREFVDALPRSGDAVKISGRRKIRGRDQMSRDLGWEGSGRENRSEILAFVRYVDEEFDLVMIREHMEASLVLLADLMAWPLHYVSFIPLNVRQNRTKKREPSEADRLRLSRYNRVDHLLYGHFLAAFRQRVLDYGLEKLAADVQKLGSINAELSERCILARNNGGFGRTIGYVVKDRSDWECEHAAKGELEFTRELRERQISRLKPIKRLEKLMANFDPVKDE